MGIHMIEEEKKTNTPVDETGYINTEELRGVLADKEKETKKDNWFKRLFKKKDKNKDK